MPFILNAPISIYICTQFVTFLVHEYIEAYHAFMNHSA